MSKNYGQVFRFVVNGVVATTLHYLVLNINLHFFHIPSAGVANFIAAIFGILISFLGSRYYVFQNFSQSIYSQALKFLWFYGFAGIIHFLVLFLWSDIYRQDYRIGFLIATALQVCISYLSNKYIVFK